MLFVNYILFALWLAALIVAIWATEAARMFARRMKKMHTRTLPTNFTPRVALILPVKGITPHDPDTLAHLHALFALDYPHFRLLFAVESPDDPILPQIHRLRATSKIRTEIIIAGLATTRGQKVHNQLAAIDHTTSDDEILAFVDADARPAPHWLRALVIPLQHAEVGAATGFRFYIPTPASPSGKPSTASAVVSVINAGVAALLGPYTRNSAWGGSMAIRRPDFFSFGVHAAWQHALSDDYVLSFIVKKKAQQAIAFVSPCLVASVANFTGASAFEFAARQYRITRICEPFVWLTAVASPILYLSALLYTSTFYLRSLLLGTPDHNLLVMFLALYLISIFRGLCLLQGGKSALPQHAPALSRIAFWYTLGYPLVAFFNLLALLASATSRTIIWRGIRYTMHSRTETTLHRATTNTAPSLPPHSTTPSREPTPPALATHDEART